MKLILVLLFLVSCCPKDKDYKRNSDNDYPVQFPSPENGNGTGVPFQN